MIYCRFSSLDWQCDVYAYEGLHGHTIHLARNRWTSPIPVITANALMNPDIHAQEREEQKSAVMQSAMEAIDLPHAGETFHFQTQVELRDKLLALKEMGYRFPDRILQRLDAEIKKSSIDEVA